MYMAGDDSTQDAVVPPEAASLEGEIVLRDGAIVHVRPIRPSDTELLRAFHAHLSADSIIFRFFHFVPFLSEAEAEHFTHLDYQNRMALLATTVVDSREQIIAVVRYDRTGLQTAEVAFVVADRWQGHGIATTLLHQLAAYARALGFTTFVAVTMGSNMRMLDVLHHAGFPCTTRYLGGDFKARLDISAPPTTSFSA
jgi:RimJ/RimL family protein N-acetyltransferase